MSKLETIHAIANELAAAGKTPSVAMVKAKLSSSVPLPQIINALKCWQYSEPSSAVKEATTPSTDTPEQTEEQLLEVLIDKAISQALAPVMAKLDRIEALLEQQKS